MPLMLPSFPRPLLFRSYYSLTVCNLKLSVIPPPDRSYSDYTEGAYGAEMVY